MEEKEKELWQAVRQLLRVAFGRHGEAVDGLLVALTLVVFRPAREGIPTVWGTF